LSIAPLSFGVLLLTLVIPLGVWIKSPGKANALAIFPSFLSTVLWFYLLISKDFNLFEPTISFLYSKNAFDFLIHFSLNSRTVLLVGMSSFIALLIQLYSLAYLDKNENHGLFHFLISLFGLAMNGLFLAGNLFSLFIFWELVGLFSYLLVQFWYQKEKAIQAGIKVFLINKMGDIALLSGLGLLLSFGLGSLVVSQSHIPDGAEIFFHSRIGSLLVSFFVLSALVKSAQFPFGIWLKEAMQGPTSVSALLHSATMVVAGLWLLIQLSPALGLEVQWILMLFGGITFLLFNLLAIFSNHLKNTLAFSTLAQLGMMTLAIGTGKMDGALLHLVAHAFFKAGLFLVCGWLMHQAAEMGEKDENQQYIPNLQGLLSQTPLLKWSFLLCLASLAGWPLTSGFISKESLFPHFSYENADWAELVGFLVFQIGIFMTAFYTFRMGVFLAFSSPNQYNFKPHSTILFGFPIAILALFSGFWIFGLNPFSSQGWLAECLGISGQNLFPDVFMLLLGSLFAWNFARKKTWPILSGSKILQSQGLELKFLQSGISGCWKMLMAVSKGLALAEKNVLDYPLNLGSKIFVVGGYFVAFADRFLLDGLINLLAKFTQNAGSFFWVQAKRNPQYTVFFVSLVLAISLYFSFF
jgi:NADH-quinone oxidoreductase subunit L